ncbi:MAG: hypothetical protein HYR94_19700 [Chloroflexi bacterium]|nr:hypothetical protein [Chloroflexota bacterium]
MITPILRRLALRDFEQAAHQVFWRDLRSRLTGKNNDLLSFDQIGPYLPLAGQHYRDLQVVPLHQIVGSEGRFRDFDRAFCPRQNRTKERWLNIDKAYYEDIILPPVVLYQIGQMYFVRDGNHRVSVARAHGQEFIDAYVTEIDLFDYPERMKGLYQ